MFDKIAKIIEGRVGDGFIGEDYDPAKLLRFVADVGVSFEDLWRYVL